MRMMLVALALAVVPWSAPPAKLPAEVPGEPPGESPGAVPSALPGDGAGYGADGPCAVGAAGCTWARTLGGTQEDKIFALAPLPDGGAVVTGSTRVSSVARFDGWTMRVDRDGEPLWERRDGGIDTEAFHGVVATGDGGVVVAGHTRSAGAGESDLWLARFAPDGRRAWDRTLGGPANDRVRALVATADGGLAVAGFTGSAGAGGRDIWVVKLDADGRTRWERRFGGPADEMAYAAAADGEGGLLVGGYRPAGGAAGFDAWLLRLDADGELLWETAVDRTPFDIATAVALDGETAVVAMTSRTGGLDVRLARFAADGTLLWDRTVGGDGADTAWALAATADGYVLAGSTGSAGAGSQDLWLVGLDRAGAVLWERTHGGPLWERATSLAALADGSLLVGGYTTSLGAGFEDGWLLRLDARGRR